MKRSHTTFAVLLAAMSVCSPEDVLGQSPLTTVRVTAGLTRPVWLGAAPRDYDRLFVLEKDVGRVRIIKNGALLPTPFLTVQSLLRTGGERGLLGMAFHPDYANNGRFFLNYTRRADGATVIAEYRVSSTNPDLANPQSARVLMTITQPYANHNGGEIAFGPDGYLYIGMGDGGSGGDPRCYAQNGQSLLGKILRIDVDQGSPYGIPPTNPFVRNSQVRNEIWALGVRNPWRFSFDPANGDLYFGDVGQNRREEIGYEPAGRGGLNHGWKIMEGTICFGRSACATNAPQCNSSALTPPIYDYATGSNCSVTGGFVYRGCAIPDLRGTYIFGDYCSGRIWSFRYQNGRRTDFQERTAELTPSTGRIGSISAFGRDAYGELYVVGYSAGAVFKIMARAGIPGRDLGFAKVGSNGKPARLEICGLLNPGNSADVLMRNVPSRAPAALLLAETNTPIRGLGTTVVPSRPIIALALMTDQHGEVRYPFPGGVGPYRMFVQGFVVDQPASFGIGVTNALQIDWR